MRKERLGVLPQGADGLVRAQAVTRHDGPAERPGGVVRRPLPPRRQVEQTGEEELDGSLDHQRLVVDLDQGVEVRHGGPVGILGPAARDLLGLGVHAVQGDHPPLGLGPVYVEVFDARIVSANLRLFVVRACI